MDPSELAYVSFAHKGRVVDIPVELERSEAVCEAANRPVELVIGDLMTRYTSLPGDVKPAITEVMGKVGALEDVKPIWVGVYRPLDSIYYNIIGSRKILVVYKENVKESEARLDAIPASNFEMTASEV